MEIGLLILAIVLAIPATVIGAELFLAQFPTRRKSALGKRLACVVLIPAHNEASGISRTIGSIKSQLLAGDRLLVVADNCDDRTAELAQELGAEVIERRDNSRRGKGYALDFGFSHLESATHGASLPSVVVVLDADCVLGEQAIEHLVRQVEATGKPAQATYLMSIPNDANDRQRVSAFALRVKNALRPRGLDRLGMPCLLTGSGMAFPWSAIASVSLASGNIVEDMQLGLDLALCGSAPRFCPEALVIGETAPTQKSETSQRKRWEHGHLQTMWTQSPRLMWAGLTRGRLSLMSLAMELSVPPLTMLLTLMTVVFTGLSAAWWFGASMVPALVLGFAMAWMLASLFVAWLRFGRADLPARSLVGLPLYLLWKLPIALTGLVAPQRAWIRTERSQN